MTDTHRQTAEFMKAQLESQRLAVCLVPIEDGRKVRRAVSHNPRWYQELCKKYTSGRGRSRELHDTLIKRQSVLRALDEIASGRAKSLYAERVMHFVELLSDHKKAYEYLFS